MFGHQHFIFWFDLDLLLRRYDQRSDSEKRSMMALIGPQQSIIDPAEPVRSQGLHTRTVGQDITTGTDGRPAGHDGRPVGHYGRPPGQEGKSSRQGLPVGLEEGCDDDRTQVWF